MSPTRPASPPPAPKRPPHLRPLDGPGRDALVHVIVFDFRDARVKLTKMQSMWYHLVFRLWPWRSDGGTLPSRGVPGTSFARHVASAHLARPSVAIPACATGSL